MAKCIIMKKVKFTVLDKLLTLLGFSSAMLVGQSCAMYGEPYGIFSYRIKVTDEANIPIQGMRVIYKSDGTDDAWLKDTTYTDANGLVQKEIGTTMIDSRMSFAIDDVDGPAHGGLYASKTVKYHDLEKVQTEKGRGFYEGSFEYSADVKLELLHEGQD